MILDVREAVRTRVFEAMTGILSQHGHSFSGEMCKLIYHSAPPAVWLKGTGIDLFSSAALFDCCRFMLDRIALLLQSGTNQVNKQTAKVAVQFWATPVDASAHMLDAEEWSLCIDSLCQSAQPPRCPWPSRPTSSGAASTSSDVSSNTSQIQRNKEVESMQRVHLMLLDQLAARRPSTRMRSRPATWRRC